MEHEHEHEYEDEKIVRLGISLPRRLLEPFDALRRSKCYRTRSEAVRDLIRKALIEEEWKASDADVAGTLTLVYDHHVRELPILLMDIQHDHHDVVVSTQHVHLDHHNCLEVLILRGAADQVAQLADRLIACHGVKHGVFVPSTTGKDIA